MENFKNVRKRFVLIIMLTLLTENSTLNLRIIDEEVNYIVFFGREKITRNVDPCNWALRRTSVVCWFYLYSVPKKTQTIAVAYC